MAKVNAKGYAGVNVRKEDQKNSEILYALDNGTEIDIVSCSNGMGKLKQGGWINMDYISDYDPKPQPKPRAKKPVAKKVEE